MVFELLSITVTATNLLVIRVLPVGTEISSAVDGIETICRDSELPRHTHTPHWQKLTFIKQSLKSVVPTECQLFLIHTASAGVLFFLSTQGIL